MSRKNDNSKQRRAKGKVDIVLCRVRSSEVEQTPICDNVYDHAWIYFLFCKYVGRPGNGQQDWTSGDLSKPSFWVVRSLVFTQVCLVM